MKNYVKHLLANWKVAIHALFDFFAHFTHGLFPFVKIKHHQPVNIDSEQKFHGGLSMEENRCSNYDCILNVYGKECSSANCTNCEYREIQKEDRNQGDIDYGLWFIKLY